MIVIWGKLLKFEQILKVQLKFLKVFKKILIKIWKNLTKIWQFSYYRFSLLAETRTISHPLQIFWGFGGNVPPIPPPWSRYCWAQINKARYPVHASTQHASEIAKNSIAPSLEMQRKLKYIYI